MPLLHVKIVVRPADRAGRAQDAREPAAAVERGGALVRFVDARPASLWPVVVDFDVVAKIEPGLWAVSWRGWVSHDGVGWVEIIGCTVQVI